MAGAEVISLSSSPPREPSRYGDGFALLSSPVLPSPSAIIPKQKKGLISGSRAAKIPEGACIGFTRAATLLHTGSSDLDTSLITAERPNSEVKNRASRDAEESTAVLMTSDIQLDNGGSEATKVDVRAMTSTVSNDLDIYDFPVPSGQAPPEKLKRARQKRASGQIQTKIRKGKVSKPGCSSNNIRKSLLDEISTTDRPDKQDTVGKMEQENRVDGADTCRSGGFPCEPLDLEQATVRRRDWTPPADTSTLSENLRSSNINSEGVPTIDLDTPQSGKGLVNKQFGTLLQDFAYGGPEQLPKVRSKESPLKEKQPRKRRKLETVETSAPPEKKIDQTPKPKPSSKAPKKKAQTITGLATAQYLVKEQPPPPGSINQFLGDQPTSFNVSSSSMVRAGQGLKLTTRKGQKKEKRAGRKSKGSQEQPILLSPESAMKSLDQQDLLFGTSSQLAREDSPTMIRDLQRALRASEVECDANEVKTEDLMTFSSSSSKQANTARKARSNLWSAASRDFQGSVMEIDVVDLTRSSFQITRERPVDDIIKNDSAPAVSKDDQHGVIDDGWIQLADTPVVQKSVSLAPNSSATEQGLNGQGQQNTINSGEDHGKQSATSTTTEPNITAEVMDRSVSQPPAVEQPAKPDFHGYNTHQLAKEVKAYGFKPIKHQAQMIALLEQCWEQKNKRALQLLESNSKTATAPASATAKKIMAPLPSTSGITAEVSSKPVKRPRGRPKKADSAPTGDVPNQKKAAKKTPVKRKSPTHVEEISDSDSPPTPSPPRRRSPSKPPNPLQLSLPAKTASIMPSNTPDNQRARKELFRSITKAVKNVTPSEDPSTLTWHQKMLMYDPIVLEDLAAWLNTDGLARVGVDEEVDPAVVRDWCESKGVCCVYRVNFRGVVRSRF